MNIKNIVGLFLIFVILTMPSVTASDGKGEDNVRIIPRNGTLSEGSVYGIETVSDDGEDLSSDSNSNTILTLIDPLEGLNEVLNSPAGKPTKKVINLVVGFAMLYTIYSLIKDYLNSQSDNSEKSSKGFINMGKHTAGLLILLICLGFVGVFMNYQL